MRTTSLLLLLVAISVGAACAQVTDNTVAATSTSPANPAWTIAENSDLEGATGRLIVDVPVSGASMIFHILKAGSDERIDTWYGSGSAGFYPGVYDVKIWEERVSGVSIEKGKDTRVHVGALSLSFDGTYAVFNDEGDKIFNGIGSEKPTVVLPAGTYRLELQGGSHTIEIEDGKVTEF